MSADTQEARPQQRMAPQLRRFLRALTGWAAAYITVAAIRTPVSTTTWLDAWMESVAVGVLAGLVTVWIHRARPDQPSPVWGFIGGLAFFGWLGSVLRPRGPGRFLPGRLLLAAVVASEVLPGLASIPGRGIRPRLGRVRYR